MVRYTLLLIFLAGLFTGVKEFLTGSTNPPVLRIFKQHAFNRGEVLMYRMHYGWIDAGWVKIEVTNEAREIGGRKTFHFVGTGESNSAFDLFYKVRDRYESYMDEEAMAPWIFIRRVEEGGFQIKQDYVFNHFSQKVDIGNNNVYDIPEYCQDMTSAFYYARCLNYDTAKMGDVYTVHGFVDKEVFAIKIRYMGKDTIVSDVGRIACIKFRPILQKGRIFKREEDLNVWVSDDKNHIPIRAEAKIWIGAVKMDLMSYENLANALNKNK